MEERRQYPRYFVQDGTLAIFRPDPSRLCQIENISRVGMMVRYIDIAEKSHDFSDIILMKTGGSTRLNNIPFAILRDEKLERHLPCTTLPMRRSNIKFGPLDAEHQQKLEQFIESYRR